MYTFYLNITEHAIFNIFGFGLVSERRGINEIVLKNVILQKHLVMKYENYHH